jgi:topoisomerase IA-like protein
LLLPRVVGEKPASTFSLLALLPLPRAVGEKPASTFSPRAQVRSRA